MVSSQKRILNVNLTVCRMSLGTELKSSSHKPEYTPVLSARDTAFERHDSLKGVGKYERGGKRR